MIYHLTAFVIGFVLDRIIGDPMNFPHPIRLIGRLISFFDKKLLGEFPKEVSGDAADNRDPGKERAKGFLMVALMLFLTGAVVSTLMVVTYRIHPYAGVALEAVLTCYCLAAKSLRVESMKVAKALKEGTLEDGRKAVSMIVGRDTANLDEKGVIRAAVETVAENTSDGVIAPLLCTFIGGPVFGLLYKTVNTMDSMVGYHNDRYGNFGFAAAKLDDLVNYLPARISAVFMILAAFLGGKDFSGIGAWQIFKRDRYNHKSPNSAQTESACAGALGLRLAGSASYFGKIVQKPYIGDPLREEEIEDIGKSNKLMYLTCDLVFVVLLIIGAVIVVLT